MAWNLSSALAMFATALQLLHGSEGSNGSRVCVHSVQVVGCCTIMGKCAGSQQQRSSSDSSAQKAIWASTHYALVAAGDLLREHRKTRHVRGQHNDQQHQRVDTPAGRCSLSCDAVQHAVELLQTLGSPVGRSACRGGCHTVLQQSFENRSLASRATAQAH
jgi:hypothetical protein